MKTEEIDLDNLDFDEITEHNSYAEKDNTDGKILELEIAKIKPDPNQPRKTFDNDKLTELSNSIIDYGLMQPITVRKLEDGTYIILAGERRYKAHEIAQLETIKCIVIEDSKDLLIKQVIENTQRDNLTVYEEALSYQTLWKSEMFKTKKELAQAVSKTPTHLSKMFSIFDLAPKILEEVAEGKSKINIEVLSEISKVNEKSQKDLYNRYVDGKLTRDGIRIEIKSIKSIEEASKEKLLDDSLAEEIKKAIFKGASYCKYNKTIFVNNTWEKFLNQKDVNKMTIWMDEYKDKKEELEKEEKLNDEKYESEVKKSILKDGALAHDSSIRINDNWVFFKNDKDLEKIKNWIKEREEIRRLKDISFNPEITLELCETMAIEELEDEVIRIEEIIKENSNEEIQVDNKFFNDMLEILKSRLQENKIVIIKSQFEEYIQEEYEISTNRNFIYEEYSSPRILFFNDDEERNLYKEKISELQFENMKEAMLNPSDTEDEELEDVINDKFSIVANNENLISVTFRTFGLKDEARENLLKDIKALNDKYKLEVDLTL